MKPNKLIRELCELLRRTDEGVNYTSQNYHLSCDLEYAMHTYHMGNPK